MSNLKSITDLSAIDFHFNDQGLIPAILQDYHTREILMMAWMNAESLALTLETGNATFFSRSRGTLWTKGETSGHFQKVVAIDYDCDADTLLLQVTPIGPACHTGRRSCFYRRLAADDVLDRGNSDILTALAAQIEDRKIHPIEGSYTNYLFNEGIDKICKKVGEEATETVIAAKNGDPDELVSETADLLYHLTVLLNHQGTSFNAVYEKLAARHQTQRRDEYGDRGKIKK